ncbi:MAG: hypothetical protein ACR2PL_27040 [Dehalococcoidia bacterium]
MLDSDGVRQATEARNTAMRSLPTETMAAHASLLRDIGGQQHIAEQVGLTEQIQREAQKIQQAAEVLRHVQVDPGVSEQMAAIETILRDQASMLQQAVAAAEKARFVAGSVDSDNVAAVAFQAFKSQAAIAEAAKQAEGYPEGADVAGRNPGAVWMVP